MSVPNYLKKALTKKNKYCWKVKKSYSRSTTKTARNHFKAKDVNARFKVPAGSLSTKFKVNGVLKDSYGGECLKGITTHKPKIKNRYSMKGMRIPKNTADGVNEQFRRMISRN